MTKTSKRTALGDLDLAAFNRFAALDAAIGVESALARGMDALHTGAAPKIVEHIGGFGRSQ